MASNSGKLFESQFKKSVPDYCYLLRLNDPPQSFGGGTARFSIKNPFDYLAFDTKSRALFCLELKTTKYKSMSVEDVDGDDKQSKMIHKHQILGLTNAAIYDNVCAGFLLNFRDDKNGIERCYFQMIDDFNEMMRSIDKKSFNEIDLLRYNAIKVDGTKKRVRYIWDIDGLMKKVSNK